MTEPQHSRTTPPQPEDQSAYQPVEDTQPLAPQPAAYQPIYQPASESAYVPAYQPASNTQPIQIPRARRYFNLFLAFARGIALFIALYSLLSSLGLLLGNAHNQNLWWIDLSALPIALNITLQALLIIALFALVVHVPSSKIIRALGGLLCLAFTYFALSNAVSVYSAQSSGSITLGFPIPFSIFIALAFLILAFAYFGGRSYLHGRLRPYQSTIPGHIGNIIVMFITVVVLILLFPLGQVYCFGTTEYKNPVDATVVLGAQVQPDGTPSLALQDRLDKAISLYDQGETPILIMSGGIDADGVSEAAAMRDYAVAHGVPASSILIDEYGNNTEATVKDTLQICSQQGYDKIGAVSSFYHMARIKMLYLSYGHNVYTRPVPIDPNDNSALYFTQREIPSWCYYWTGSIYG